MMLEVQKRKLEQRLWNMTTLRRKMEADEFHDYIIGSTISINRNII